MNCPDTISDIETHAYGKELQNLNELILLACKNCKRIYCKHSNIEVAEVPVWELHPSIQIEVDMVSENLQEEKGSYQEEEVDL